MTNRTVVALSKTWRVALSGESDLSLPLTEVAQERLEGYSRS